MTEPLGYFTSYDPICKEPGILHSLQAKYGDCLQKMNYEQKIVMRTALCTFISQKPVWEPDGVRRSLIDLCIESAGVDWDIWHEDEYLAGVIQACELLEEGDIEGLILALSSQIKDGVYASRIHEWFVI